MIHSQPNGPDVANVLVVELDETLIFGEKNATPEAVSHVRLADDDDRAVVLLNHERQQRFAMQMERQVFFKLLGSHGFSCVWFCQWQVSCLIEELYSTA